MLGLPNKVPHADFMSRYSIIAPKIFSDMAGDARGCAAKALVEAGLDADEFRCGSTKVRYYKDGYKHILGVRVCRGWGSGFVVGKDVNNETRNVKNASFAFGTYFRHKPP